MARLHAPFISKSKVKMVEDFKKQATILCAANSVLSHHLFSGIFDAYLWRWFSKQEGRVFNLVRRLPFSYRTDTSISYMLGMLQKRRVVGYGKYFYERVSSKKNAIKLNIWLVMPLTVHCSDSLRHKTFLLQM